MTCIFFINSVKYIIVKNVERGDGMKKHKFWAYAAIACMAMVFYTGYKHK